MTGHGVAPPVIFTGGVALVPGMAEALSAVLKSPVRVAPKPQMTGALGAALLACRQATSGRSASG
jgi:activator of 2-hydroxyglutaryl-CoA dehydratase